ncbi:MAG: GGDEF domain-containing protein [Burkholderiaceae bacterium]
MPAMLSRQTLDRHRALLAAGALDARSCHGYYGRLIAPLLRRSATLLRDRDMDALRAPLSAYTALAHAKEQLGRLRAVGVSAGAGAAEAGGRTLQQLAVFDAAVDATLEEADDEGDEVLAAALRELLASKLAASLRAQAQTLSHLDAAPPPAQARAWFDTASELVGALQAQQQGSLARMRVAVQRELADASQGLASRVVLVAAAWLGSCWLVYAALRRLLATIRRLDAEARALFGQLPATDGQATRPGEGDGGFMQLVERVDELGRQARTDALTGVLNRHGLEQRFDIEHARAQRYGRPIGVVVADIDHFKQVNDGHGHATGDIVLREFAQLLRRNVRADDIVARWGGEEFVVVAPESDEDGAAALAEKLRAAVTAHGFALPAPLSASFGAAALADDEGLDGVVARADAALYHAKAAGRNRVGRATQTAGAARRRTGPPSVTQRPQVAT